MHMPSHSVSKVFYAGEGSLVRVELGGLYDGDVFVPQILMSDANTGEPYGGGSVPMSVATVQEIESMLDDSGWVTSQ